MGKTRKCHKDGIHDDENSCCDHFKAMAQKALDEWDGQDTVDLFTGILYETGESEQILKLTLDSWYQDELDAIDDESEE